MTGNHIVVLLVYSELDIIRTCFDSLNSPDLKFFIVENKSKNSNSISSYFKKKNQIYNNIVGYIQFDENISFKAMEIFVKDYYDLLKDFDYITFSDGDIQVNDLEHTLSEIVKNINMKEVGVCCVDLSMDNFPSFIPGSETWIPAPISVNREFIECPTGIHLCTVRKENLVFFQDKFIDTFIHRQVNARGLKWAKTLVNKGVHLTWDLYKPGNDYFEFKKNTNDIWSHSRTSSYTVLI